MVIAHYLSRPLLSSDNEYKNQITTKVNRKHGVSELQNFDINMRAKLYLCLNNLN